MGNCVWNNSNKGEFVKCAKCRQAFAEYRAASTTEIYEIKSFYRGKFHNEYQYTACDFCANKYVERHFTYILGGWREIGINQQKYEELVEQRDKFRD